MREYKIKRYFHNKKEANVSYDKSKYFNYVDPFWPSTIIYNTLIVLLK